MATADLHPATDTTAEQQRAFERLLEGRSPDEQVLLRRSFALATQAHAGQTRRSGEPYITHPLAVAGILHELGLDHETLAAALTHDVVEDTPVGLDRVRAELGDTVAALVEGVTKMVSIAEYGGGARGRSVERQQVERLKKLLLAMASDVRVVLVKLADRLHNMRTLRHLEPPARRRIAAETLEIYAPLASRLGIARLKWELEDLCFRELEPDTYVSIARQLDERRSDRERYVQRVVGLLGGKLAEQGIRAEVRGRVKHIYSIWRKMQQKSLGFEQVFDARAVRVLVDDVAACYAALGVVHTLWRHVAREFDDYIANPKSNGYRSLHTAVLGPEGRTLEVQIRTWQMHRHAEYGVAAHWRYKEGAHGASAPPADARAGWLRQILDVKDDEEGPRDFLDRFNAEVLEDRVYVVTPKGEVLDLPAGATPLDFAYHVHTDVGHRCRGAKVNRQMVPLTRRLRSGDQVEVLTTRNATPSRDWLLPHLGYLATSRARHKVRHWFKHQDHEKNVSAGNEVFQRELKRLGVGAPDRELLLSRFNYKSFEDLLAGIGCGDVSPAQLAGALQQILPRTEPPAPVPQRRRRRRAPAPRGVRIQGVGDLLTQIARCCQPVPGDAIVGFITRGRGVSVHRKDCPNMLRLDEARRTRLVDVSWAGESSDQTYAVRVLVRAYDRRGLLSDVTTVLSAQGVNIDALDTRTAEQDRIAEIRITLQVSDLTHLSRVLDLVGQIPNVFEARRTG